MTTSDLAIPPWLGIVIVATICGAALWKGGWPERIYGAAVPLAWAVTALLWDWTYSGIQWSGFVVDLVMFALLLWLGLTSDRFWPLWAAGFRLLAVLTHAASVADKSVGKWAYISAGVLWSYLGIFALAFGVLACIRRRAAHRRAAPAELGPQETGKRR